MKRISMPLRRAVAAGGAVAFAFSTGASRAPSPSAYGFVLTGMGTEFYRGDERIDCPEGRSHNVREAYLATQSVSERARLLKPENSAEFEQKYKEGYVYGPGGRDICTDAAAFDTPDREIQKPVQSKIAPGMNLDASAAGRPAAGTCAHSKFVSPDGEAGVDNQFFRAIACNTAWRGALSGGVGDFLGGSDWRGEPAVVVVRNVENWNNDPDVEVVVAASTDQPTLDATGKVVAGASLTMTENSRYRTVLHGKIVGGVLTTDPANLVLPFNWVGASGGEFIFNHARIRARLTADGELTGEAGGYRPIDNAIAVLEVGGPGVAQAAGVDCASVRKTLRILADGDPDSSGQCTSVSTALTFAAKPAFVFERGSLVGVPGGALGGPS